MAIATPDTAAVPAVPVLECTGLSAGYGQVTAVREVDLCVRRGEMVALLGANGAGKTTTLLTLAGELHPMSGEVRLLGEPTTAPMERRCRAGLGFVPEERAVISQLTTVQNLRLAGADVDDAFELFPELARLSGRRAGLLSGGEQQMLTLARALGRHPQVLLVDELSLGLAPLVVIRLLEQLRRVADERGIGILFVEQHVRHALEFADRVSVMQRGRVRLSGSATEVRERLPEIEGAYFSARPAGSPS